MPVALPSSADRAGGFHAFSRIDVRLPG